MRRPSGAPPARERTGRRPLRWELAVVAVVAAVLGGPATPVAADTSMRPLEEALGDSLEVRRGTPPAGPDSDEPPSRPSGDGPASEGADEGGGGEDDGMRDLVPTEPADGPPDGTTDDPPSGGSPSPTDADPDDAPELEDAQEGLDGEGRGAGELASGLPDRALPIVVALLTLVGAFAAIVFTQRRWERSEP